MELSRFFSPEILSTLSIDATALVELDAAEQHLLAAMPPARRRRVARLTALLRDIAEREQEANV